MPRHLDATDQLLNDAQLGPSAHPERLIDQQPVTAEQQRLHDQEFVRQLLQQRPPEPGSESQS